MTDLEHFERSMRRELSHFMDPGKPKQKRTAPSPPTAGLQVQLIVREGPLKPDTLFIHDSAKISRLEARLEAEKAAKSAGWPIIGRVHDIVQR